MYPSLPFYLSWQSSPGTESCWCLQSQLWKKALWVHEEILQPSEVRNEIMVTLLFIQCCCGYLAGKTRLYCSENKQVFLTSSIPEAVKKIPTSAAYFCSSLYCSWLNSRWRLCSPYVFPQECLEVYGLSKARLLNLYFSSLFWNLAQSAPQSCGGKYRTGVLNIRIKLFWMN